MPDEHIVQFILYEYVIMTGLEYFILLPLIINIKCSFAAHNGWNRSFVCLGREKFNEHRFFYNEKANTGLPGVWDPH